MAASVSGNSGVAKNPMEKYLADAQGPDSFRAWFVALFAGLYVFFGWCAFSSTPVLYVTLMDTNCELSRKSASWPFTIMSCCTFIGSAFYAFLAKKVSEKKLLLGGAALSSTSLLAASFFTQNIIGLVLTLGVCHGFGLACTTCIPSAVITQHFIKHRATAMSLFSISAALSGIVYPMFATLVYREFQLSGLLLILSGVSFNQFISVIVCDRAPWKPALQAIISENESSEQKSKNADSQTFCSGLLVNVCISNALANFIMFALVLFVIDFEIDNGIDSSRGATLVVTICFGWLIASIVVGPIVDRGVHYDKYVVLSSCILQGLALLSMVMPYGKGVFWRQLVSCFVIGWGQGSRGFLMYVMLSKQYSPSKVPMAFAVMNFSCVLPFLLRTPLIGLIRDNLGEYDYIFYLFILINAILSVDWLIISVRR